MKTIESLGCGLYAGAAYPRVNTVSVVFLLQMVEVMEGSGVYWYPHQWAYCSAFKHWPGYINAAIDIFITTSRRFKCVFLKWLIPLDVVA